MKNIFITLEGPDGSGKTTQIELLKKYLESRHYEILVAREPGGTKISEKIREIILDKDNEEISEENLTVEIVKYMKQFDIMHLCPTKNILKEKSHERILEKDHIGGACARFASRCSPRTARTGK